MRSNVLHIGLFLAISFNLASSQGYGNIEDDTPSNNQPSSQQQAISSLPQYDPAPEGYAQQPQNSNLQGSQGQNVDQSRSQDYWWLNQNAFQKPPNHPGVESSDNAPSPQNQNRPQPQPSSGNRAYNPTSPQQNAYNQQPRPQQPRPKPQRQQQYQSPGSGWSGPQQQQPAQSSDFNLPPPSNSLSQPEPDFQQSGPKVSATPECQLLNKEDCHPLPLGSTPEDEGQGYNIPAIPPPQNYRPPSQQQPRPQTQQFQPQPQQTAVQTPPGFYQPPQQSYDSQPQNQNYQSQPQFSKQQPSQPYSSSFPQGPSRPQNFQPSNRPQQQYNRPAPPQNQQYQQNNAQSYRPQSQRQPYSNQQQQQPAQNYEEQAPSPLCPAAMLCVEDDRCNLIGTIEDNLRLSSADKAHRVALSQCSQPNTEAVGVCCRDPNYVDPWPDMNGKGQQNGQYHPHHETKGQASQGSFRNPYSDFGERMHNDNYSQPIKPKNIRSHNNNIKPNKTEADPSKFYPCFHNESCVIHYQCPKANIVVFGESFTTLRRCREDNFKNSYVCCKRSISITTTTSTTQRPTAFLSSSPNSIYRNNPYLSDTLSPKEGEFLTSTDSPLITGHGLKFHSHLHTKEAIETNNAKPNPYEMEEKVQPAIIVHTKDKQIVPHKNISENSNNSLNTELETASTNLQASNSTEENNNSNYTEVYEPPENRTRLQTFWNTFNQENVSSEYVKYGGKTEVKAKEIPVKVPLKDELSESPPFGFLFKGYELYVPQGEEAAVPKQHFIPPKHQFGERTYPAPEDFPAVTTMSSGTEGDDTTTIISLLDDLDTVKE